MLNFIHRLTVCVLFEKVLFQLLKYKLKKKMKFVIIYMYFKNSSSLALSQKTFLVASQTLLQSLAKTSTRLFKNLAPPLRPFTLLILHFSVQVFLSLFFIFTFLLYNNSGYIVLYDIKPLAL